MKQALEAFPDNIQGIIDAPDYYNLRHQFEEDLCMLVKIPCCLWRDSGYRYDFKVMLMSDVWEYKTGKYQTGNKPKM